jgi:hypothetical protein
MKTALLIIGIALASLYALWILFVAVMNIQRVQKEGNLTRGSKILAVPVVLVAYTLDVVLNYVLLTVILFELPKEKTISQRLKRHNQGRGSKWGAMVARFVEPILDPYDYRGDHI